MKEWWTLKEIVEANLPEFPDSESGVTHFATRKGWKNRRTAQNNRLFRKRKGRGGGWEYHYHLFPELAQMRLLKEKHAVEDMAKEPSQKAKEASGNRDFWMWWERQTTKQKEKAMFRLETILQVQKLVHAGKQKDSSTRLVARNNDCTSASIYNWLRKVEGEPRDMWLPHLCSSYVCNSVEAEFTAEAWEAIKADYLRLEKPSLTSCYERLTRVANTKGWAVPSVNTVRRRIEALPHRVIVAARDGEKALKALYPAQERDRSHYHALEAVNIDGHKWDVWVKWPGIAKPIRPMMVAIQDLYSGKILSWRLDISENITVTRLAFKDLFENYGIPETCWLDNGAAFSSQHISGNATFKFKGKKVKEERPDGILKALGVEAKFTTPYSGQSKPIERAFRDLCDHVAKHPEFAGAYTGNTIDNQPENYGSRAIELEHFVKVIDQGIKAHNAKANRKSKVCAGTMSFDEAFAESYAKALIRKPSEEQLMMCMLAAEPVTSNRKDGTIKLYGNRYYHEKMAEYTGKKLVMRFDPDDLYAGVHVYRLDGTHICHAPILELAGFEDLAAARKHNKARRDYVKASLQMADIERHLDLSALVDLNRLTETPDAPVPNNKTTRLVTQSTTKQALALAVAHEEPAASDSEWVSAVTGHLHIVTNDELI